VVSEISQSSISVIRPIKESIPNFSQSAHARVDRNRETTDFTYLTHLLCCPQVVRSAGRRRPAKNRLPPALGLPSAVDWAGEKQAGGMVISANAEGLRARRRSHVSGRRLEEVFPSRRVRLAPES
jgi:hypothetical protein